MIGIDAVATREAGGLAEVPRDDSQTWFGNIAGVQADAFRFIGERLAKDARTLARLAMCRSPMEVAQLQMEAGAEAAVDYFNQVQRCFGMYDAALADTSLPVA